MDRYLRACLAELVGTFFLTFLGAGAICTDAATHGKVGLLGIAIAHAIALSVGVSATMNISGGHLNPAVTLTMWVFKKIDTDKTIYYIASQLLGAIIAGGLILAFFSMSPEGAGATAHFGTPHISKELRDSSAGTWGGAQLTAIGIEAVLTFMLVFTVFGTAVDPRAPKIGGFGIGLIVGADILVGGPLTGAAMNPARAFGPAIWEAGALADFGLLKELLVYLIGPVVGGILAGGLYLNFIMPPEAPSPTITHGK
jgi:aquaporin Z